MDPDVIGRIAERKIQQAIDEGKFDNLPGNGTPIVFDRDIMTPHLRMANKILKNAGVLPDWVRIEREIETEQRAANAEREKLLSANREKRVRLLRLPSDHSDVISFAKWHARSRADYVRRLKTVNTLILKFCLLAPSTAKIFKPCNVPEGIATFDLAFPPLPRQPKVAVEEPKSAESLVRGVARMRYQNGRSK